MGKSQALRVGYADGLQRVLGSQPVVAALALETMYRKTGRRLVLVSSLTVRAIGRERHFVPRAGVEIAVLVQW